MTPKGGSKKDKDDDEKKRRQASGNPQCLSIGLGIFFTDFSAGVVLGFLPLFLVSSFWVSRASLGVTEGSSTCKLCF